MTERAASRPLGAFLRLTVASLQTTAGRLRDRAFGIPVRTGSGADLTVRSALLRFGKPLLRASAAPLAAATLFSATLFGTSAAWAQATAPGTPISNVAQATFQRGANPPTTVDSNVVVTTVEPPRSRATLELMRPSASGGSQPQAFGPSQCLGAGGPQLLADPVAIGGIVLDPSQPLAMASTASYHAGEPVFLRLSDPDQNRDAALRETIDVRVTSLQSGDSELLRVTETDVSSGVFLGYVQSAASSASAGDCALQVARDSNVVGSYVDVLDGTDTAQAQALIDPTGLVFDSRTGQPVSGARIRIVDAATGQPAGVLGDDGLSSFPSEIVSGAQATDSGGTVYAFAPGAFRFPVVDAPAGYRFEVVPPAAYRFPSTESLAALALLPGAPFTLTAGSFGDPFNIDAPAAANIDVPLDAASGQLFLDKSTLTAVAAPGDLVQYRLRLEHAGSGNPLPDSRVIDVMPAGLRYRAGSTRINDAVAPDPQVAADGRTLTFDTGVLAAGASVTIRYVAEITVGARGTRLVNRARASAGGGSVESNPTSATIRLREELQRDRSFVMGRVTEGGCEPAAGAPGVAGVRVYLEDGRYTVTDAEGKYHFEDVAPGSHVVQVDEETVPDTLEPVLCAARSRHAGRAYSRFIELHGGSMARADFTLDTRKLPQGTVERQASRGAAPLTPVIDSIPAASDPLAVPNVESLAPGIDWVLPAADFSPAITSMKVALRHAPDQHIALMLNGAPVSALNFYGTAINEARTVAMSLWRGVDIPEGASELTAVVNDASGGKIMRLSRSIHFAGGPVRGELLAEESLLVADGRTRPVVRLRLTDVQGKPARQGTLGAFHVDPPHRSWFEVAALEENKLLATGRREPIYAVGEDGIAAIELEPTTQTGRVVLRLRFGEGREQEMRAWLKPAARDWVLVGIAEGTAAYRTLSGNMEAARDAGIEAGYADSGRVALFAKGRIRGDFLLTLAYDSARDPDAARARLHDVIEPQRYYTLYGDGAEQRNEAASTEKLYLKLERGQFYALFGDFDTGLTVTELARYSRTLTGLRTEWAGSRWGASAFAAHTDQSAIRDELRGDGTSGLYRLSRGPLLAGSDKIRIEVRDRFRTERVLETRPLARFLDYSIDYVAATVFFKEPVPSRDAGFNPVFIIVEYETEGSGSEDTTAGARASRKLAGERLEIGASMVHEGAQTGDRELAGVDLRWKLGEATEFKAEAARSEAEIAAVAPATAYLAELSHVSARLEGRVYAREQESQFGLGQQLGTETGTRKIGAEGRLALTGHVAVQAEAYRQNHLAEPTEREMTSVELRYQDEIRGAGIGVRHVADQVNGLSLESQQAFAQASVDLFDQQLRLRASTDMGIDETQDSIDFPSRSVLGADWRLTPGVALFTEYEHAEGANVASDMTRVGVKASPWNRAQLLSSVNQQQTENGARTFANLGLTQGFQLNERWALDLGLDQSNTLRGPAALPLNPNVPLASGTSNDDFLAAFAAALYRSELWTFTSRLEHRASDLEDRFTLTGGFYREPVAGHAFSMATTALGSDALDGTSRREIDVRLGWAYRPVESRWIVLDRLDLIHETLEALGGEQRSARIVNTLNANWQIDAATELGLQYGARYARNTFDGSTYAGFSDLYGSDLRRDLNERFDIGLHASALSSWSSDVHDYAVGVDLGVTLARNVWIAVGYNLHGFRDEDFSQNRYTDQGPFIKLRVKADQDTLRDLGL